MEIMKEMRKDVLPDDLKECEQCGKEANEIVEVGHFSYLWCSKCGAIKQLTK